MTSLARATTPTAPNNETANLDDNALTPVAPVRQKTRFSAKAAEVKEKKATTISAKKQEKIDSKPVVRTADEAASAKVQSAPLGLNGDTSKKPPKPKRDKNAPKERLEDKKSAPKAAPTAIEQTVSPSLAPTDATPRRPRLASRARFADGSGSAAERLGLFSSKDASPR